jgi:hypothetical protein
MRKLAGKMEKDLPGMTAHMHLRDAATQMERGNTQGTFRHLYAATNALQPQALFRHGHLTDDVHAAAKQNMGLVHREILKSRDIEDMEQQNQQHTDEAAANQANIDRMRAEKLSAAETPAAAPPPSPAMNAPGVPPTGGPDPSVAGGPKPPPATTSQNHSGDVAAIELVGPHGYVHGWIKVADPSVPFGSGTKPGSFEHIAAIQELADKAASGPVGDPAHQSSVMSAALHNVAGAVARRDIAAAKVHMKTAAWGNKREAGGAWSRELAALGKQLDQVPAGATGFQSRTYPGSGTKRAQHPGTYVPTGDVPANPTRGATRQFVTATMANGAAALELARGGGGGGGLRGHVQQYHSRMVKSGLPRSNHDLAKAHAQEHHRFGSHSHRHEGVNLGPNQRPPGWTTGGDVVELSADTGALAVTPHPFGKPGGPGLWGVKNMQLPPYVQNIAHALLRTGRAKTIGQAIAMARAATKRWLHGKNTKPEVRAASGASDAEWRAKQAVAHADHALTDADVREIYALACQLTAGEVAIELAQLAR